MNNIKILNKKAIKEILTLIKKQWDCKPDLDYGFLEGKDRKIFIISKDISKIQTEKLRINKIGIYFGQLLNNELRLSIEGSQIIGPTAKTNILELSEEDTKAWLRGEDIPTEESAKGFVLIKHKSDFIGTGKIKENKVLNFIPKGRRIKVQK